MKTRTPEETEALKKKIMLLMSGAFYPSEQDECFMEIMENESKKRVIGAHEALDNIKYQISIKELKC